MNESDKIDLPLDQILEDQNNEPLYLATKKARLIAFLLDFTLILAFSLMVISIYIIPKHFALALIEFNTIFQAHFSALPPSTPFFESLVSLAQAFTPPVTEMFQSCQSFLILAFFTFFALSEILTQGSSLGKRIFSIKVLSLKTLSPPSLLDSFVRASFKTLSLFALFPILLLSFLYIFFSKRNQTGHDLLSRTVVIVDSPSNNHKKKKHKS